MRNFRVVGCFLFLTLTSFPQAWADTATCKIKIQDVNKGSTYTLEQKFDFKKDGVAQRKNFETPGNDYACTLAFFELKKGTMLSCGYKKDAGQTFFQSDRSVLDDDIVTNNLTFRHQAAFIVLETRCE